MGHVSLLHPYRYMAALAGPSHVCACVQDLGIWFEARIFLFLLTAPQWDPRPVTQAALAGMWGGPTAHLLLVIRREHGPWAQPHLLLVRERQLL